MTQTSWSSSGTAPLLLGEVYLSVTTSIEHAEVAMSKARTSVEKAQASKENRQKVVSKASKIVNALLEPASQVVNLLDGIGALFPPCKVASNTLSALVKLEVDRRDNDVRIALLFLDFATALANLGMLSPGFQSVKTLTLPLESLLQRFTDLMKEFGQFCKAYYGAKALKSKLRHLLRSKTNKDSLQSFTDRLVSLKNDLIALLSHQTVLMLGTQANILKRIESRLAKNHEFYAAVSDENEDRATAFVISHGGVEVVQMNDRLLQQLAATVGEDEEEVDVWEGEEEVDVWEGEEHVWEGEEHVWEGEEHVWGGEEHVWGGEEHVWEGEEEVDVWGGEEEEDVDVEEDEDEDGYPYPPDNDGDQDDGDPDDGDYVDFGDGR